MAAIDCVEEIPGNARMIHSMKNYCEEQLNKTGKKSLLKNPQNWDFGSNKGGEGSRGVCSALPHLQVFDILLKTLLFAKNHQIMQQKITT